MIDQIGCHFRDWKFPTSYQFPQCKNPNNANLTKCIFGNLHSTSDGGAAFISQTSVDLAISDVFFFNCSSEGNYGGIYTWLHSSSAIYVCDCGCEAAKGCHSSAFYLHDQYTSMPNDYNYSITTHCKPKASNKELLLYYTNGILRAQFNNFSFCALDTNKGFWFESENDQSTVEFSSFTSNEVGQLFYTYSNRNRIITIDHSNVVNNTEHTSGCYLICASAPIAFSSCYFSLNTYSIFCSSLDSTKVSLCSFCSNSFTSEPCGQMTAIKYPRLPICEHFSHSFTIKIEVLSQIEFFYMHIIL